MYFLNFISISITEFFNFSARTSCNSYYAEIYCLQNYVPLTEPFKIEVKKATHV